MSAPADTSSQPNEDRPAGLLRPLRVRDFRLLWVGQTVSLLGDGVLSVALAWQTLDISPHPTSLALVLFARVLPRSILLLVGGAVSDRFQRRTLMLVADAAQAVALGAIALLAAGGGLRLWQLSAFAAVSGVAGAFFLPSSTALVPDILPDPMLLPGNALNSTSHVMAEHFAGPALGGLLVATVGTAWAFGIDAFSFAVSVATLAALRVRSEPSGSGSMLDQVREGIRYTRSQRWLWVSLMAFGLFNFLIDGPISVLLPVLVRNDLGGGAGALGLVLGGYGLGGLVAALASGRVGTTSRPVSVLYGTFGAGALLLAGLGLTSSILALAVLALAAGALFEYGNLVWTTLLQRWVPRDVLGRVASLDWFMSLSLIPISVAISGPIALAVGAPAVFVGGGLLAAAVDVGAYLVPGMRAREPVRSRSSAGPRG